MKDNPLRQARKAKGLTAEQVGAIIGITKVSVGRFEAGKASLTVPHLYAYARAVGLESLARELEPVVQVRADYLSKAP